MRKILAAIGLVLALFCMNMPANAGQEQKASVPDKATVSVAPPSIYTWDRMTSDTAPNVHTICVANGDNSIPIAAAAQSWNNASSGVSLDFSANCVADGYGPGVRMTIDTFHDPNWGSCFKNTNLQWILWQGWHVLYNNPIGWVNTAYNCTSTATQRAHWTSLVIGRNLGLKRLDGSQWASRVMCYCAQFGYPSASTDGDALTKEYDGTFIGAY